MCLQTRDTAPLTHPNRFFVYVGFFTLPLFCLRTPRKSLLAGKNVLMNETLIQCELLTASGSRGTGGGGGTNSFAALVRYVWIGPWRLCILKREPQSWAGTGSSASNLSGSALPGAKRSAVTSAGFPHYLSAWMRHLLLRFQMKSFLINSGLISSLLFCFITNRL